MIKRNRKGVIGFLLTMAVGAAIGAAAIVVTKEIQKDQDNDPLKAASRPSSPAAVEKAFDNYQQAYRAYQQAAGLGRKDIEKYAQAYRQAKRQLEIEIFRNTPGVSDMDMKKFNNRSEDSNPGKNASPSTGNPSSSSSPDTSSSNPFASDNEIILTENDYSDIDDSLDEAEEILDQVESSSDAASDSPSSSATSGSLSTEGVRSTSGDDAAETPDTASNDPESQISSIEYYRVRSGDSLYKICKRYYGNGGMWSHILKYQIPSIMLTPNLIYPGQLIALPRGLTRDRGEDSFISPPEGDDSDASNSSPDPGGDYDIAAEGDESWQNKFQKDYLISDRSLTNKNTMTIAQIQSFLDSKNSSLARPYRGSTPAQMIYDAAHKYGINPQVLLTRLQCEQGLISKTSASQHKLDWALGVGCYDSGNWNQKFKGLDKQIEFAAATYRRHFDNAKARLDRGEAINMTIDGQNVRIKNAASYAFYKYCPHFQGNKLFYDVWRGYRNDF
ncbi:MAG: LysM peptidoglycan-binding domain-containing protein [Candidatus Rifleibacteriota bacterium]